MGEGTGDIATEWKRFLPVRAASVRLRALTADDADAYAAGTADPTVRAYAHLPEPSYTPERVRELVAGPIEEGLREGSLAVLAIADQDGTFLGSMVVFDVEAPSAEVGFWLAPEARGRGAATGALEAAGELARSVGLTELRARTVVANDASAATLRRAGFVPVGEPELSITPSGEEALAQHYRRSLTT